MTRPTEVITLVAETDEESMKEMITVEGWTTIRYLHAQGKPIRVIAKETTPTRWNLAIEPQQSLRHAN